MPADGGTHLGLKQDGLPEEGMPPWTDWRGSLAPARTSRWIRDVCHLLQREGLAACATVTDTASGLRTSELVGLFLRS